MSVTTQTITWEEWRLWGPGYAWSTRYTGSVTVTVTRNIGSDTATVKVDATMTTPSGDNSLGDWQCITTINGASSGGGEKNLVVATAGYHAANSSHTASATYTVNVGVSAGTLSGQIKFRIGGYPDYQGEYSEAKAWSLTYDTKGTPSQATWSNYNWGKSSTVTIQRTVPDFKETVFLVWTDDTSHPVTIRGTAAAATTVSYTIPYASCPTNAKTRTAKIRIVTYNGNTQIGTWESGNYTVTLLSGDTSYNPTLANNPVAEAYNDVISALGTDTAVAQYSKINVKAAKADVSTKYSATIASRVVTFSNGSSASADQTDHISSLIQSAGTVNWTYTVTDSRGYTVTRSGSYTVINSSAPSITNYTVYRGDSSGNAEDGGAYIYATATATCESLNGHNSVTLQGRVGSGSWQNMTNGTRKTLMSNADPNTQYVVTLKATDLLRTTTMDFILPSADCPFHIPSGKHGMGIGMKAQASDNKLYVGYDAEFYGDVVKHDVAKNIDVNIPQAYEPLVAYGTAIPANSNLNTASFANAGLYYVEQSATAQTLTNCPTTSAFTMVVRNITKTYTDTQSRTWQYVVREITAINGDKYVQRAYAEATAGSWTFGTWYWVDQSLASEKANTAGYLKAMVGRQSSIDFTHIYDGDKVHARLDIVPSSLSPNPFGTDGYALTFMWDNSGAWDTQLFIPNNSAKGLQYRLKNNSSWGNAIPLATLYRKTGTITAKNGSLVVGENYAYEQGDFIYVQLVMSGITSADADVVEITGLSESAVPYARRIVGVGSQNYYAYTPAYAILTYSSGKYTVHLRTNGTVYPCANIDFVIPVKQ